MKFAIICKDKPGALDVRVATRPDHVEYLKSSGVVLQAGPFLDEDDKMSGSLVIIEVADKEAAVQFADNDPYAKAGLFEDVQIQAWNRVIEE